MEGVEPINIVVIKGDSIVTPPKFQRSTNIVNRRLAENLHKLARRQVPVIITAAADDNALTEALKAICGCCDYLYVKTSQKINDGEMPENIRCLATRFYLEMRIGVEPATQVNQWRPGTLKILFFGVSTNETIPYLSSINQSVELIVAENREDLKDELVRLVGRIGQE